MNSSKNNERPISGSYWVILGKLLAGEYPGSLNEVKARSKIRRLLQAGVSYFIDFTEESELIPYKPLLAAEAEATGQLVHYQRMPIKDLGIPTESQMQEILEVISTALDNQHIVYVHCWGGVGRTGTVVGCFLVRAGHTPQESLRRISELRQVLPASDRRKTSPETVEQTEMVLQWTS